MARYEQTQQAVEGNLAFAEDMLAQLQQSDDEQWGAMKVQLESAWEDLARLIRHLICRLPD